MVHIHECTQFTASEDLLEFLYLFVKPTPPVPAAVSCLPDKAVNLLILIIISLIVITFVSSWGFYSQDTHVGKSEARLSIPESSGH